MLFDNWIGLWHVLVVGTLAYDGRRVVVPNSELFTNPVTVNTAFENRRLEYDVGIGYGMMWRWRAA